MARFVRLADDVLFKTRYGAWYLIGTQREDRDRFLIEGGAEHVLLFLFAGHSIEDAVGEFSLPPEDLTAFLQTLVGDDLLVICDQAADSTARCHDLEPPLDSVNLLLTNACNLRCVHCYVDSGKPMSGELSGKEWIGVLQQVCDLGAFEVNVSGGEALLHPAFDEIAACIASIPTFHANLNTNGVSVSPGRAALIAQAFASVQVSLDHEDAARHDAFRGRAGSFEKSVHSIGLFIAAGIETNVAFTLTPENIDAVDGVVGLAERLGVHTVNIGLIAGAGRAKTNRLLGSCEEVPAQADSFLDAVYRKIRKLSVRRTSVRLLLPFRPADGDGISEEKEYICSGDTTQIAYILADGSISPCDKLPKEIFTYGNIRQQSLKDAWLSADMTGFKLKRVRDLESCRGCEHLALCGGACLARSFSTGGSLESPDWIACAIAKRFARDR